MQFAEVDCVAVVENPISYSRRNTVGEFLGNGANSTAFNVQI
jgi:hypothetical protein